VPFGELRYITNYNRDWVIYKMNFRVAPETDPQQIKKIVKTIGAEMMADELLGPKLIEPLKSQGVFAIDDDSALIFRVKFMCKPREQFVLRREAYHRIQKAFAAAGIELARRKVEVVVPPEAGREEIAEAAAAATDDALKAQQGGGVNTEAR
jgi:small-conductance mechanosensitive channel